MGVTGQSVNVDACIAMKIVGIAIAFALLMFPKVRDEEQVKNPQAFV
jgi:hypothetical protein